MVETSRTASLDGLRAVAVFLVIFFHLNFPKLHGGYLGVDVFFVLSGFLITRGLISDAHAGKFSLGKFWAARIRRLFPALAVVILAVLGWAWFRAPVYYRPTQAEDAWWSALYLGNWHFIQTTDYFHESAAPHALVHVWSLAVEEQFYVAWPLLILGFGWLLRRRYRRAAAIAAAILSVISVGLLAAWSRTDTNRAYMGTDTKIFEPLLGALLACVLARLPRSVAVRRGAMWVGFTVLCVAVLVLGGPRQSYFLGGAFLVSLAVAAIVYGLVTGDGGGRSLLAWGPIAYLGRISYGLYLWHWPWAVWLGAANGGFHALRSVAALAATLVCAALSYHLLELPIRHAAWAKGPRTWLGASLVLLLILALAVPLGGTPLSRWWWSQTGGSRTTGGPLRTVLIVGDSVPRAVMPGFQSYSAAHGLTLTSAAVGGCSPLGSPNAECRNVRADQTAAVTRFAPQLIVWWSRYELRDRPTGGKSLTPDDPAFWTASRVDLERTVTELTANGSHLVILELERPGIGIATVCQPGACPSIIDRLAHRDDIRQRWNALLHETAARYPALRIVKTEDLYCRDSGSPCDDTVDGAPARTDGIHFRQGPVNERVAAEIFDRATAAFR